MKAVSLTPGSHLGAPEVSGPRLDYVRITFWVFWAMALMLKLELATLRGTFDVLLYHKYGATLAATDWATAYASSAIYNIPPLAAGFAAALTTLCGPNMALFGFLLKLPGIVGEAILAVVLWRRYGHSGGMQRWLPLAFVLNPLALAITGFHGNLDGLMAVFLGAALLSALDGRAIWCGIWLGLAINLKIAPVLLGPAFLCWWLGRRRAGAFVLAAGAVTLVGWSPGLITCFRLFLERVLGYDSLWGTWGISRLLYLTHSPDFYTIGYGAPSPKAHAISTGLKLVILAAAGALAWRRRNLPGTGLIGTIAASWTLFLVFAPGGAMQYMIWPVLPLLLYGMPIGVAYLAATLPYVFIFYPLLVRTLLPWNPYPLLGACWPGLADEFAWTYPALLSWAVLLGILLREWPRWWRAAPEPATARDASSAELAAPATPLASAF